MFAVFTTWLVSINTSEVVNTTRDFASLGVRLALFFYENLVAASVECSSRIVEVARRNEISRAKKFFASFC